MEQQIQPDDGPTAKAGRAVKVALVGAGIAAGAIGATALGANAASDNSSSTPPAYTSNGAPGSGEGAGPRGAGPGKPGGGHGANPDEQSVSADVAAKLKAAALKAVPGGTVDRVETDSGDATYEAHMTKADGTKVTVKFDKNYAVTAVEDGMGK